MRRAVVKRAVVKLGGGAAEGAALDRWIEALAGARLPIVVVPGGGRFADEVRDAQRELSFSDAAAHAMAILAMDQFGFVILDRDERLIPARSIGEIERAWAESRVPVWLPSSLAIPATDIHASWDVTSDSLAAWLAGGVDAAALLLIKQTQAFSERDTVGDLMKRGVVDPAFGAMLPGAIDFRLAGPEDAATAGAVLASGRLPGTRIGLEVRSARAG